MTDKAGTTLDAPPPVSKMRRKWRSGDFLHFE
jgi:hypothetical protein